MPTPEVHYVRASSTGIRLHGNLASPAGLWGFAIVWNSVIAFIYFDTLGREPAWMFVPLGACGLAIFALAMYLTISRRKYGVSILEFQSNAAVPGGVLTGMIRIPRPLIHHAGIDIRLACVRATRRQTAVFDRMQVEEHFVLWEGDYTLDRILRGVSVGQVPVYFRLPSDAKPSAKLMSGEEILWKLDVKSKTAGINYFASFVVPVTAGAVPPDVETLPDPTLPLRTPRTGPYVLTDQRILFTMLPDGGCRCVFLPRRNMAMSLGLGVFAVFFFAFGGVWCWLGWTSRVPVIGWIIGLIFIAIGMLPAAVVVQALLERMTTTVRRGRILVERQMALINRKPLVSPAEVIDIAPAVNAHLNEKPYYVVQATFAAGEPFVMSGWLKDKDDAEFLAERFRTGYFDNG